MCLPLRGRILQEDSGLGGVKISAFGNVWYLVFSQVLEGGNWPRYVLTKHSVGLGLGLMAKDELGFNVLGYDLIFQRLRKMF